MSYGSNYPPGVTGMEREIAGADFERTIQIGAVECYGHIGQRLNWYKTSGPDNIIRVCPCQAVADNLIDEDNPAWVKTVFDDMTVYDAQFYQGTVDGVWTCPSCGHDNEFSGDAEDYID